jgi:hypothetical protein
MAYILFNTQTLEVKGATDNFDAIGGGNLGTIQSEVPAHKAKIVRNGESFEVEEITLPFDWLGLEQALYQSPFLAKGMVSQGQGFGLLLKVLSDGKTTGASEQALLIAINATLAGLVGENAMTSQEIEDLNALLLQYNFTIQIEEDV